jgi:hypothetical protein
MQHVVEEFGLLTSKVCVGLSDEYDPHASPNRDPSTDFLNRLAVPGPTIHADSECELVESSPDPGADRRRLMHRGSGLRAQRLWASIVRKVDGEAHVWIVLWFGMEAARGYECAFVRTDRGWEFSRYLRFMVAE